MRVKAIQRVGALLLREWYVARRSPARVVELFLIPLVEVLVWSLLAQTIFTSGVQGLAQTLLAAVVLWQTLYRSQQSLLTGFMEDVWSRSLTTTLTAPIRVREYLGGLILAATIKTGVSILAMLGLIALTWQSPLGLSLMRGVGYVAVLIPFGWALGVLGMSLVLRFGHSGEVLALVLPVIVQPLSCVFYPVSSLPVAAQWAARALPGTWVFEDLRGGITASSTVLLMALLESLAFLTLGGALLTRTISASRRTGRLARFAE